MPRIHFTDIAVSALRTPGTYFDETTPAFGLRVGKNRKTWFVIRGRERLRTNIGRYPGTSLADARKEAKKLLLETPKKNANVTFKAAWEFYTTEHLASRKPRTQAGCQAAHTRMTTVSSPCRRNFGGPLPSSCCALPSTS